MLTILLALVICPVLSAGLTVRLLNVQAKRQAKANQTEHLLFPIIRVAERMAEMLLDPAEWCIGLDPMELGYLCQSGKHFTSLPGVEWTFGQPTPTIHGYKCVVHTGLGIRAKPLKKSEIERLTQ